MEKAEKAQEIDTLTEQFGKSAIALCADYRGLSVAKITTLRAGLKEKGVFGKVVKNTLARISFNKAFEGGSVDEVQKFIAMLEGPSFIVFSKEDPVAPAKVLANFAKDNEALQIKGGFFEGKFLDAEGVKNLSSLPSKEELYSKLLSIFSAPATKVVRLLQAPGSQVVRVLDAYRRKLEGSDS